jgi:sugar (pentulose or hexulose) kinase
MELLRVIDETKPGDLFLIPHFSGICNPVFNPDARGFLYGLSLHTTVQDLIQGIIEGLCYELKVYIQGFNDAGISIKGLKTVGGGSQSDTWLQLKANITGLEIIGSDAHEASAMGAAALCGAALGIIDNPYRVHSFMGVKEKRYTPSPQAVERFEEKFVRYQELSNALHGVDVQSQGQHNFGM